MAIDRTSGGIDDILVEVGSHQRVTIDKLYGPAIFAELRITADNRRGWVIERQGIATNDWREWCVIPADDEDDD